MSKAPVKSPAVNRDFESFVRQTDPDLTDVLFWISNNFSPEDVFDFNDKLPEDIFDEGVLGQWAAKNDLVDESDYVERKDVRDLLKAIEGIRDLINDQTNYGKYGKQIDRLLDLVADIETKVYL